MTSSPTPFELAALNQPGYEVWARHEISESGGRQLPYLLIVLYEEGEKPLKIIDPQKNSDEILLTDSYLEVVDYLSEEGYQPIKGRLRIETDEDDDDE